MKKEAMSATARMMYVAVLCVAGFALVMNSAQAQQLQIPTVQVCKTGRVAGKGTLAIVDSSGITSTIGKFIFDIDLTCRTSDGLIPRGKIHLSQIGMSNPDFYNGEVISTNIDQFTVAGKPPRTAFASGRCNYTSKQSKGPCLFWLMVSDNLKGIQGRATRDTIGIVIMDTRGNVLIHAAAPIYDGDVIIQ